MFQSFVQIQTTWQYNACVIGNHRKCKSKNCFRLMTLLDITYCIIILCVRQNMSYCLHLSLLFVACAFLYINVHVLLLKKKKKNRVGQRNIDKWVINQSSNYFICSRHGCNVTAPVGVHYVQQSINNNLTGMVFKENVCFIFVKCVIWICKLFYLKYNHVDSSLYQFPSEPQHVRHT